MDNLIKYNKIVTKKKKLLRGWTAWFSLVHTVKPWF